jgi:hypothetical protein
VVVAAATACLPPASLSLAQIFLCRVAAKLVEAKAFPAAPASAASAVAGLAAGCFCPARAASARASAWALAWKAAATA